VSRSCNINLETIGAKTDNDRCWYKCPNWQEQTCGGFRMDMTLDSVSVYKAIDPTLGPSGSVEGYKYLGCYTDDVAQRVLPEGYGEDAMTLARCKELCPNSKFIGLEWGKLNALFFFFPICRTGSSLIEDE
jgi:hypothetical protein